MQGFNTGVMGYGGGTSQDDRIASNVNRAFSLLDEDNANDVYKPT